MRRNKARRYLASLDVNDEAFEKLQQEAIYKKSEEDSSESLRQQLKLPPQRNIPPEYKIDIDQARLWAGTRGYYVRKTQGVWQEGDLEDARSLSALRMFGLQELIQQLGLQGEVKVGRPKSPDLMETVCQKYPQHKKLLDKIKKLGLGKDLEDALIRKVETFEVSISEKTERFRQELNDKGVFDGEMNEIRVKNLMRVERKRKLKLDEMKAEAMKELGKTDRDRDTAKVPKGRMKNDKERQLSRLEMEMERLSKERDRQMNPDKDKKKGNRKNKVEESNEKRLKEFGERFDSMKNFMNVVERPSHQRVKLTVDKNSKARSRGPLKAGAVRRGSKSRMESPSTPGSSNVSTPNQFKRRASKAEVLWSNFPQLQVQADVSEDAPLTESRDEDGKRKPTKLTFADDPKLKADPKTIDPNPHLQPRAYDVYDSKVSQKVVMKTVVDLQTHVHERLTMSDFDPYKDLENQVKAKKARKAAEKERKRQERDRFDKYEPTDNGPETRKQILSHVAGGDFVTLTRPREHVELNGEDFYLARVLDYDPIQQMAYLLWYRPVNRRKQRNLFKIVWKQKELTTFPLDWQKESDLHPVTKLGKYEPTSGYWTFSCPVHDVPSTFFGVPRVKVWQMEQEAREKAAKDEKAAHQNSIRRRQISVSMGLGERRGSFTSKKLSAWTSQRLIKLWSVAIWVGNRARWARARAMQERLEVVWNRLEVPQKQRVQLLFNYTKTFMSAASMEAAGQAWVEAADLVMAREKQVSLLQNLLKMEKALCGLAEEDRKILLIGNLSDTSIEEKKAEMKRNLTEVTEKVKQAIHDMEQEYQETLTFQGVNYLKRIKETNKLLQQ